MDVTRLMVLVSPPYHLKLEEAEAWLRGEAAPLAGLAQVERAALSRLGSASDRWGAEWGWLIELEFPDSQSARRAVGDDACALLLGDLRLLGMRPTVALIESARELGP